MIDFQEAIETVAKRFIETINDDPLVPEDEQELREDWKFLYSGAIMPSHWTQRLQINFQVISPDGDVAFLYTYWWEDELHLILHDYDSMILELWRLET